MGGIAPQDSLLRRLIGAAEMRSRVIAANLANQSVPGYVRQVVRFEDLLRDELAKPNGHPERIAPQIVEDRVTPGRPDGNNVNLELELNAMRENRILHETYLTMLTGGFHMLEMAMSSNG